MTRLTEKGGLGNRFDRTPQVDPTVLSSNTILYLLVPNLKVCRSTLRWFEFSEE